MLRICTEVVVMTIVMLRTAILYLIIILALRIMGKRQLGELQPSELVTTILISNIATLPIEDTGIPMTVGIVPIFTLMCFEVFTSFLVLKSRKIRKIVTGNPVIVIRDGKIQQQELERLRLNVDDIMTQLRSQDVFDIEEVSFAIVETTGTLSVYKKFSAREVTAEMMGLSGDTADEAPPMIVISDGNIIEQSLSLCNLRKEWLREILAQNNMRAEEVFLMSCDRRANYTIVAKEKKEKRKQR